MYENLFKKRRNGYRENVLYLISNTKVKNKKLSEVKKKKGNIYQALPHHGDGLFEFYGISTVVDYLIANTAHMVCQHILLLTF